MNICINDKPADITLNTEKTLGDVLAGIELWISPGGNRIHRVAVNGRDIPGDDLAKEFSMEIKDIKKLDIDVSSYRELAAEALISLHDTCSLYEQASFEDRSAVIKIWENSAAVRFLQSDIPDIYELAAGTFSGTGLTTTVLAALIEERLREITDPVHVIGSFDEPVKNITERMEELPLDMQTGKDQRAAETIQLFSGIGEKLFRIFYMLKKEGLSLDSFIVDDFPVRTFIEEFNAVLSELSAAYENRDTVLVGDLSEYELAPRLLKFFLALKKSLEKPLSPVPDAIQ